jgi:hypothetical protein
VEIKEERRRRQPTAKANLDCPKRISDYLCNPTQLDMTHSSANDIVPCPPSIKLTTLDNGLVIIVRRKIFSRFRFAID